MKCVENVLCCSLHMCLRHSQPYLSLTSKSQQNCRLMVGLKRKQLIVIVESVKWRRMPLCDAVFGSIECIDIPGCVLPPAFHQKFLGRNCGIQGHQNSCYMDATLFSMFSFSMVFDSILHRPRRPNYDGPYYDEVQRALREGIVNPLRK